MSLAGDPNSILMRHRNFLKNLETKKNQEREEEMLQEQMKELKAKQFREQAAAQREKIKTLKQTNDPETLGAEIEQLEKPPKLSEAALKAVTSDAPKSQAPSQKGKKKPAWAVTEKQSEDNKEAEID